MQVNKDLNRIVDYTSYIKKTNPLWQNVKYDGIIIFQY